MAANSILTIDMITAEAQRIFENAAPMIRTVNKQYDDSFAKEGAKIGSTLRVRLPDRALVTKGAALQVQDESQQYTNVSITDQAHIGLNFTTAEMTLSLDKFTSLLQAALRLFAVYACPRMGVSINSSRCIY